ncbi:MAG TPA: uroporphyrinogen decarboxylase family protein [Spirochaetia bacterium]|nr:uroporphyrinogen decarboxylase family protein [Spirochaetia bacterium]
MAISPRQRFLQYVTNPRGALPVVSPFLPHQPVIRAALAHLGLSAGDDFVANEITLARRLGYQPMFMTDFETLLFPWKEERVEGDTVVSTIEVAGARWERKVSRSLGAWGSEDAFPVKEPQDHRTLALICEAVADRTDAIRAYFRAWRQRAGEEGVIVLGHPHVSWLGCQIGPQTMLLHWADDPDLYRSSMEAVYRASLVIMEIALAEGIDFMSESSYGLEMSSPALIEAQDLPYIRRLSTWTHRRGGKFWYHNCGHTRTLIRSGVFDRMGADLIETVAPPPCGDNDLGESRRMLDREIVSKGNFDLGLLREGTVDQVTAATRAMVASVRRFPHVFSTADAVLEGTPPANFIAFVETALREA